jgi:hypothetical protein
MADLQKQLRRKMRNGGSSLKTQNKMRKDGKNGN